MDTRADLLERIASVATSSAQTREASAKTIAEMIRSAKEYRWVGLYDVGHDRIVAIAWTGSEAPAHPSFPLSQGLNGAAVSLRQTVIVGDVAADPRYLQTFGHTRSELVVPVFNGSGQVVGTIDVESDRPHAFGEEDRRLLEACAAAISGLWA